MTVPGLTRLCRRLDYPQNQGWLARENAKAKQLGRSLSGGEVCYLEEALTSVVCTTNATTYVRGRETRAGCNLQEHPSPVMQGYSSLLGLTVRSSPQAYAVYVLASTP